MAGRIRALLGALRRLRDPAQLQLWLDRARGCRGIKGVAQRQGVILLLTARRVREDEITRRAAALTYFSLLSLVPVLAVAFALFEAFGGLSQAEGPLRQFVLENLAVGTGQQVATWLGKFIDNINAGAIAGVGVLVLFYSAVGLLTNVERSLNSVWGVQRMRPLLLRFAIYWCVITLAPPLLGVSLSLSASFRHSGFAQAFSALLPFGLDSLLLPVLANLSVSIAFVLLYLIFPNTKVKLVPALLGGLVAGLLWTAGKAVFLWLSARVASYSAIYGALGALPLISFWIYYSWLVTLFGTAYTYANQAVAQNALRLATPVLTPRAREVFAARILLHVAHRFCTGQPPRDAAALAAAVDAPLPVVQRLLDLLVRQGLLLEVSAAGAEAFALASDPHTLSLADLIDALRGDGDRLSGERYDIDDEAARLIGAAESAALEVLGQHSLADLAVTARVQAAVGEASQPPSAARDAERDDRSSAHSREAAASGRHP